MTGQSIEFQPISGALGAEVIGIDLSAPLSNTQKDALHQAFLTHKVLLFRNQKLVPSKQVELARIFGQPAIYPFLKGLDEAPEVNEILKTEKDTVNFGGTWHSDTAYKECPDMGTLLYAHEVPPAGGDTLFTNMTLAYEALSDAMKDMLAGLTALYSSERGYGGNRAARMKSIAGMKDTVSPEIESFLSEHPIVRTHPETGQKALYVSKAHTISFAGMTEAESAPLITYLSEFATRPEFTCRVRWQPQTLAIWDNRCTKHYAINDYAGQRRRMHRVTIQGDRPS